MNLSIEPIASPLGELTCVTRDGALVALEFPETGERLRRHLARRTKKASNVEDGVLSATDSAAQGGAPPPLSGLRPPSGCLRGALHEEGALPAAATLRSSAWGVFADGLLPSERGASGEVGERILAYFAGDLDALDDVHVDLAGTPFERRVYAELRRVRRGEVVTYSELARRAGHPAAVRAVGATNAKNPISIVVPCHRVIGADGSLTGYAGGLDRKRWLLAHEGVTVR